MGIRDQQRGSSFEDAKTASAGHIANNLFPAEKTWERGHYVPRSWEQDLNEDL